MKDEMISNDDQGKKNKAKATMPEIRHPLVPSQ
jgi:hypothetical protein